MFALYLLLIGARIDKFYSFRYKPYNNNIALLDSNQINRKSYSLYIHIPFCENLCEFCFFHKFPYSEINITKYYKSLITEIDLISKKNIQINNIYIGGGTPTIYLPGLTDLLEKINLSFEVKSISVETDPYHINEETLNALKTAKVNRLSIGIQSFNEQVLNKAGRVNRSNYEEIKENIINAINLFETVNIDLIFNFKKQNIKHIDYDIKNILELCPHQITYYPIMEHNKGLLDDMFSLSKEKEMYFYIIKNMQKHYHMNSVWSFASKKNIYDEYLVNNPEFLCAGCGSFGYYNGFLYSNSFNLDNYINRISKGILPIVAYKKLNSLEKILYLLTIKLYSLRFNKFEIIENLDNRSKNTYKSIIKYLTLSKIINIDNKYIQLTKEGLYYWLNIMKHFYINVNTLREFCKTREL